MCEPRWTQAIDQHQRVAYLDSLVHRAVNDRRGIPSVGAVKPKS